MHRVPWIIAALVALSALAWLVSDLVPFILFPLVLAAALFVAWLVSRRGRGAGR